MEIHPVKYRIEKYLETIDWDSRKDIAKVLVLVEECLKNLEHKPSGIYAKAEKVFNKQGLTFNGVRVVRVTSADAFHGKV